MVAWYNASTALDRKYPMDPSDQLFVCVFDEEARADEVYRAMRSFDRRLDEIKLGNIAVARKSADGQVTSNETYELKSNQSLIGSLPLVGMLVGLVAASTGKLSLSRRAAALLGGGAGLVIGVIISTISELDLGFPDEALRQIGEGLAPNQSAIVMLVRPGEEGYVRPKLISLGGAFIQSALPRELIARLTAPRKIELIRHQAERPATDQPDSQ
jgi:uncharacterized membrane protein